MAVLVGSYKCFCIGETMKIKTFIIDIGLIFIGIIVLIIYLPIGFVSWIILKIKGEDNFEQ